MNKRLVSPLPVLYEDAEVLALDKPAGIAVIPGRGEARDSSLRAWAERERGERLWVVHRLDRDVSGVLVLARGAEAHRRLSLLFEKGEVKKSYWALVEGRVEGDSRLIDLPLRTGGHGGKTVVDLARGKPSRTRIRVIERLPAHTRLSAEPLTGRTHQLRVHLRAIGHPLAVDRRYGRGEPLLPRASLHAERLVLPLAGGESRELLAPLPAELAGLLERLRRPA